MLGLLAGVLAPAARACEVHAPTQEPGGLGRLCPQGALVEVRGQPQGTRPKPGPPGGRKRRAPLAGR
eukprot:7630056-Lingulodinium_polyedra.AAC.1